MWRHTLYSRHEIASTILQLVFLSKKRSKMSNNWNVHNLFSRQNQVFVLCSLSLICLTLWLWEHTGWVEHNVSSREKQRSLFTCTMHHKQFVIIYICRFRIQLCSLWPTFLASVGSSSCGSLASLQLRVNSCSGKVAKRTWTPCLVEDFDCFPPPPLPTPSTGSLSDVASFGASSRLGSGSRAGFFSLYWMNPSGFSKQCPQVRKRVRPSPAFIQF